MVPLLVVAAIILFIFLLCPRREKLPPGCKPIPSPPGLPLIGNLHQLPADYPWRKFKEWSDIYGPIMKVKLGRQELIVLSDNETAQELLEKRGQNYSSRPQTYMACELLSNNLRPLLLPYGDRWRRVRKFIHQMTMPSKATQYQSRQDVESRKLLYDMMNEPEDFARHYYRYASGLIIGLTYNKKVITGNEDFVQDIVRVNDTLEHIAKPGAFLVDSIPMLRYLPDSVAPFKRLGKDAHHFEYTLFMKLLRDVKNKVSTHHDSISECFIEAFFSGKHSHGLSEEEGAYACGTMFEAGSGTTSGALEIFTMALLKNPEVLKAAQEEVDKVCGNRIPSFSDQERLPYIRATAKEALRWRPIVTSGITHMSVKEDVYNGFFIPANSAIIGNSWAIHMDPKMYPDPDKFNPNRFLDTSFPTATETSGIEYGAQRGHWAFGFGRRACPGQHIGERSMFITIARLVWAFNFCAAVDTHGVPIEVDTYDFTTGFNSKPNPFPAKIEPRSQEHVDAIIKAYQESHQNN